MAYATKDDLVPRRLAQNELVELTDDAGAGKVDDDNVANILTEASALVDSYCRQRYTVPLQTSDQVKSLTLDIAVYKLFERRRRIPDSVKDAYVNALAFLKDVATSKAALDQPANTPAQTGSGAAVATSQEGRFDDDNIEGYV